MIVSLKLISTLSKEIIQVAGVDRLSFDASGDVTVENEWAIDSLTVNRSLPAPAAGAYLKVGSAADGAVLKPASIDLGGTHSTSAGAMKLKLYVATTDTTSYGLGVSAANGGSLDYIVGPVTGPAHNFYTGIAGAGKAKSLTILSSGQVNKPRQPYFSGTLASGGNGTFGSISISPASFLGFTAHGTFIRPIVGGIYFIHFQQLVNPGAASFYYRLVINSSIVRYAYTSSVMTDMHVTAVLSIPAGASIEFQISNPVAEIWGGGHSSIAIYKVG